MKPDAALTKDGLADDEKRSSVAVLLIDVINDFDFEGGENLLIYALPAARKILQLKKRAREADVPVIYVNDNFGKWRSDFQSQVKRCLSGNCRGRSIVELLTPDEQDYFVLKPMHSGFYSTVLQVLLERLSVKTLILTGFASNICVLFTAHDAHMRNFNVVIPNDCSAAESVESHAFAMNQLEIVLKADVRDSTKIDLKELDRP